ncbi:ankyrin repeat domain-containing protein [Acidovorax sp. FJL06]|uniref:ankyrin repeat domain-containing protein n=1 Tax=Acidovorax sp. FJL06 TaxID=2153365 RepID=UPI000F578926|nr:ankyrin repeat domain-containing protein [Acidovorax sp. FJL06]RQO79968.1 hypothetical protein DBV10_20385 [Acidovorax sp. FJL06]
MKRLPPRPDLGHLKKQAKDLLAGYRSGERGALARFRAALPAAAGRSDAAIAALGLRLHDAQSCLAREHGFAAWPDFQGFVLARRALVDDPGRATVQWLRLVYAGDIAGGNHSAQPRLAERLWADGAVPQGGDPWLACAVGDAARLRQVVAQDPGWVHRPGGPLRLPPLMAVAHSSLARLPAFAEPLRASMALLLEAGADANQRVGNRWPPASLQAPDESEGLSALYGAAGQNRHAGMARLLLAAGADPNDGESLYHALESLECTRLLLAAGARVPGTNALYRVLDMDDLPALQLLLAHGADANEQPAGGAAPGGAAPLLWAIRRRRSLAHVQALVAAGADPAARAADGTAAHIQALRYGLPEVAAFLRAAVGAGDVPDTEQFVAACAQADEARARALLAAQPGLVAALSPPQQRLLPELAAQRDCGAAVRLMVRLGWPIEAKGGDWDGSALHLAIFRGDAALTRFLLEHGARWQATHGFEDNACGALSWGSINTPEEGGDWVGCALALLDHGLPGAAPDPKGSEAVLLDGRLMRFSDEVTECVLGAAALPIQSAQ